jgi:hypothetical protein
MEGNGIVNRLMLVRFQQPAFSPDFSKNSVGLLGLLFSKARDFYLIF